VARTTHLPILAGHEHVSLTTLVDRDSARASELARAYGVETVLDDMNALGADVDAVVLATPPAHHAAATIALAARRIHVLVEKPMAITTADAEAMVNAADRAGIALSVGLYRRTLPAVRLLKSLLASGEFGKPISVDIEEGGTYGWQLATLDVLTAAGGGGGVLIDIGSHVLDVLLFALPGQAALHSYQDNSRGGIETDCVARASVSRGGRQIPVRLELSRTRELRNSIRVECEHATLELLRGNFVQLLVHRPATMDQPTRVPMRVTAEMPGTSDFIGYDGFRAQIDGWLKGILSGEQPDLSGRSVLPVVALIEDCYKARTPMLEPWIDEGLSPSPIATSPGKAATGLRRRVLVTGAGGFVGGRAVELLAHGYGYDAVALIKEPRSAARLARWPTEILLGDVCSTADMDRAMRGCDAVVHCAVGTSWMPAETRRVTVEGTRTVAEAALRAGVKRFVHISTMFVHRRDGSGVLDEQTPLDPPADDDYGRNKLDAEKALERVARRGLSAIVLRPTRIYGPFSKTFTVRPLQALLEGRLAISGDSHVPANMVYVDNVVAAIAQALEAPDTRSGGAYLITDPEQVSLQAFYEFFAGGRNAVRIAPREEDGTVRRGLAARWSHGTRAIVMSSEVRALVHRVMDTDAVGALPRWLWDLSPSLQARLLRLFGVDAAVVYRPRQRRGEGDLLYYGNAERVSGGKAERELGFVPPVPRECAMALTLAWARSARLVVRPDDDVASKDW